MAWYGMGILTKNIVFVFLIYVFTAALCPAQEGKGGFFQGLKSIGGKLSEKLNEAAASIQESADSIDDDTSSTVKNLSSTVRKVEYSIRNSVDRTGNLYISYQSRLPSVMTFVNNDGSVTVCASDEAGKATRIYEYSPDLEEKRTLNFQNEIGEPGAFTKDSDGNYYVFYAKPAEENQRATENMSVVKYNNSGEKLKAYYLKAYADGSFLGIKEPFAAGTCRLELSGSMLAVYFAREMFKANDGLNHQASYGFVVNKDTLERLDKESERGYNASSAGNMTMPYVSHSFNQFILPVDGGFVFVDHGDASPRSFTFAKFKNEETTKRLQAFKFPGQTGQNATYAEMGGLAKTSNGYIFCGAYGRDVNNARNVFILTFDENLSKCGNPVYITSYTKDDSHAGHPKIAALEAGRYLILWEKFRFSTQEANMVGRGPSGYQSTYMTIIDESGKSLSEIQELKGRRLNMNDVLRYNPTNGKAYWAINNSGKSITVYALDVKSE